ncbi:hypothetical protein [Hydromonas duriensis]|uniref:Uncharacterized protein n=1 Tax=Hydromonas duriensis TaxID=1527608 RepID=A0A4R6Y6J1_9BURK|nr:hypothetical protein [Hydromonas duriensis]TDR31082.1 hypothetical protein DFR44_11335 [Hydromonas duriensis]
MFLRSCLSFVLLNVLLVDSRAQNITAAPREVALSVGHEVTTSDQAKVFAECTSLDMDLRQAFVKLLEDAQYSVHETNKLAGKPESKLLDAKIVDVISAGNSFLSHEKVLAVKLDVYVDGVKVKTRKVTSSLQSGSLSNSCSILTRQAQSLAVQLVAWFNKLR